MSLRIPWCPSSAILFCVLCFRTMWLYIVRICCCRLGVKMTTKEGSVPEKRMGIAGSARITAASHFSSLGWSNRRSSLFEDQLIVASSPDISDRDVRRMENMRGMGSGCFEEALIPDSVGALACSLKRNWIPYQMSPYRIKPFCWNFQDRAVRPPKLFPNAYRRTSSCWVFSLTY